jgi:PET assembly of cytochrome c oxidase, mitochondrial
MNPGRPRTARGPAIVLGLTCVVTLGAIIYSHYSQVRDRQVMREGVERDKERLRLKRKMLKDAELQGQ